MHIRLFHCPTPLPGHNLRQIQLCMFPAVCRKNSNVSPLVEKRCCTAKVSFQFWRETWSGKVARWSGNVAVWSGKVEVSPLWICPRRATKWKVPEDTNKCRLSEKEAFGRRLRISSPLPLPLNLRHAAEFAAMQLGIGDSSSIISASTHPRAQASASLPWSRVSSSALTTPPHFASSKPGPSSKKHLH